MDQRTEEEYFRLEIRHDSSKRKHTRYERNTGTVVEIKKRKKLSDGGENSIGQEKRKGRH